MNEFKYNMDNNLRMNILSNGFYTDSDSSSLSKGGIIYFEITGVQLKKLIDNRFIDLNDKQNLAPSVKDFLEFYEKYSNEDIIFEVYAVIPEREDYRVSITGLWCETENDDFIQDFGNKFNNADEFICENNYVRCWYD